MDPSSPHDGLDDAAASLEAVLLVQEAADNIVLHLARVGDARDLGRAACVCKSLRAASCVESAWRVACTKQFFTAVAARESLAGAAASSFSWRNHFLERWQQPWNNASDDRLCTSSLADHALLVVDVWHGAMVFSATLSPKADEQLEDETYSDSDDLEFDIEWKAEFAIDNQVSEQGRHGRHGCPAFVRASGLHASAWLLRRSDGRMVRVMSRMQADIDFMAEGSVGWSGSRMFSFSDGPNPGKNVRLRLGGWMIEEKTGYRWWRGQQGPRPSQLCDPRQLTRMRARWKEGRACFPPWT